MAALHTRHVCEHVCLKQACVYGERASTHMPLAWLGAFLAALAEVQALSAFLVLHAEPQSCARADERRTVAFHFNGAMLATMYLCYGRHGERGRRRRGL